METELKVGDVVRLKTKVTHLPVMVINEVQGEYLICIWWSSSAGGEYKTQKIHKACLIKESD